MLGDTVKYIGQPGLGFDAVEFRRFDQREGNGG